MIGFGVGIEGFDEAQETLLELIDAHARGLEVDIEEGAKLPGAVLEDAAFGFESGVEGSSRKSGQEGDLDLVKAGLADEVEDMVENFRCIAVQAQNKTAVHGDAEGLDFGDRVAVFFALAHFPIGIEFDAVEAGAAGAFEADKDLLAPGVAHQAEQFVIAGDIDIGFGKPAEFFGGQSAQQILVMSAMDEAVVIGELDERTGPDLFNGMDFVDDLLDWFEFVMGGEEDGTGAEVAFMRAAPAGLDCDPIVFIRVEQIESGHGGVAQVESAWGVLGIERLESVSFEIRQKLGPQRFAFADDDAGAMFLSFVGEGGNVQTAHDHWDLASHVKIGDGIGLEDLG